MILFLPLSFLEAYPDVGSSASTGIDISISHSSPGRYAKVPRGRFDSHHKWILKSYRKAAFCLKWTHYSDLSTSDHSKWLCIDLNGSHISYAPISCWHCIGLSHYCRGYDAYSAPPCEKIVIKWPNTNYFCLSTNCVQISDSSFYTATGNPRKNKILSSNKIHTYSAF